jgi:ribosomal protein S16
MKKGLSIKLCRFGKKHQPFYRLGVLPIYRHPSRQFVKEFVGWYNPNTKELQVDQVRLDYYLAQNITLTDTVKSLLQKNNLLKV